MAGQAEGLGEVAVHVEVAADVRAGQAQLARPPQDPAQRPRGPGDQDRGVRGSGLAAVPGAQPDRQVQAGLGLDQVRDDARGAVPGLHVLTPTSLTPTSLTPTSLTPTSLAHVPDPHVPDPHVLPSAPTSLAPTSLTPTSLAFTSLAFISGPG